MTFSRRNLIRVAGLAAVPGRSAWAQPLREVSYALPSKSIASSAPRLADALGLFAKHGIQPHFVYLDSTSASTTALLSRSVQVAASATAEVIAAVAKNQQIVIVANHYKGFAASLVLTKAAAAKLGMPADAPIQAKLKALDNLLIASTTKVSNITVAYQIATKAFGATPRFTYMALSAMGAALEAGVIDGAVVTAPYWAFPILQGTAVLWISAPKGEIPAQFTPASAAITVTTRATADANPELMRAISASFEDLVKIAADRPADIKATLTKLFPDVESKALDLVFEQEGGAFAAPPLTQADVQHDIDFMQASGLFGKLDTIDAAALLLKR